MVDEFLLGFAFVLMFAVGLVTVAKKSGVARDGAQSIPKLADVSHS